MNKYYYQYYELSNIETFSETLKGFRGDQGEQGFIGEHGDVGLRGLGGAVGSDGLRGAKGVQGVRGNVGDLGDPGKAGDPGDIGIKGIKGVRGPTGDKGPTGARGVRGLTGPKGKKGLTGKDGPQGVKGDSGKQFSRLNTNDGSNDCEWIKVNHDRDNFTYCPNNKVLNGIRSSRRISKVEVEEQTCCTRTCKFWRFGCKTTCDWCVNNDLTTYQYNRIYDICCVDMPFTNEVPELSDDQLFSKYKNEYDGEILKTDYVGSALIKSYYDSLNLENEQINRQNIINFGKNKEREEQDEKIGSIKFKNEGQERLDPDWGTVKDGPLVTNLDLIDGTKTTLNKYPFHLPDNI